PPPGDPVRANVTCRVRNSVPSHTSELRGLSIVGGKKKKVAANYANAANGASNHVSYIRRLRRSGKSRLLRKREAVDRVAGGHGDILAAVNCKAHRRGAHGSARLIAP